MKTMVEVLELLRRIADDTAATRRAVERMAGDRSECARCRKAGALVGWVFFANDQRPYSAFCESQESARAQVVRYYGTCKPWSSEQSLPPGATVGPCCEGCVRRAVLRRVTARSIGVDQEYIDDSLFRRFQPEVFP